MLRRVQENVMRRLVVYLKWMKTASNTYYHLEPLFSSFDSLLHFMVTRILKTRRHRTYVLCLQLFLSRNYAMAPAVGSQRLTASAVARPFLTLRMTF
jgi:hypothetical protein